MDSMITGILIRGARAMLRWSTVVLAKRSNVLRATILQAESVDGFPNVDAKNLFAIKAALSAGGVRVHRRSAARRENEGAGVRHDPTRSTQSREGRDGNVGPTRSAPALAADLVRRRVATIVTIMRPPPRHRQYRSPRMILVATRPKRRRKEFRNLSGDGGQGLKSPP